MEDSPAYAKRLGQLLYARRVREATGKGRYRRNLPVRAAAEEMGIGPATLSRMERGGVPDMDTFIRACKWLGVSADELLGLKK